ncbi:MAG: hypothetical protein OYH77_07285, partial [Pseudomonadota bacterium]|nr:hypothetical protein [Pseudomonadota bacterium]
MQLVIFINTIIVLAIATPSLLYGGYGAVSLDAGKAHTDTATEQADIEAKLWSASELDTAKLETQIVRGLQQQPDSAYYHYLLAMLYLRQSQQDPLQDNVINKAMLLG